MKHYFYFFIQLMFLNLFLSCAKEYQREPNCDLDTLNLKGNVTKLEVTTQTTIPISEWLYSGINTEDYSRYCRKDAVYSFMGNSSLEFDYSGNIKNQTIYDNEGNLLYSNSSVSNSGLKLYNPININVNELVDGWDFIYDEMGRVASQKTSHNGKLFLKRDVKYNKNGDIEMVICQYRGLEMDISDETFLPADTTFFKYMKEDSMGNWTLAEVYRNGRLSSDSYKFVVKRKISYVDDTSNSGEALISELNQWNNEAKAETNPIELKYKNNSFFSNAINLKLPIGMELDITNPMPNNLLYKLSTKEGFFSVNITRAENNGSIFERVSLKEADEGISYLMGNLGIVLLKMVDYSVDKSINHEPCLYFKYYHYATGGYLSCGDPLIIETYSFQPNGFDTTFNVSIGYDSYHKYQYESIAEQIFKSIEFNNQ